MKVSLSKLGLYILILNSGSGSRCPLVFPCHSVNYRLGGFYVNLGNLMSDLGCTSEADAAT